MSIPASYSDRPLWIILAVDAALTPVGIFASAWVLRVNDPWEAIYAGTLATGIVVGTGVVLVGVASMVRDLFVLRKNHRTAEEMPQTAPVSYTPPPAAVVARRTAKDWRHPIPVPLPSNPDQYFSVADGDAESPAPEEEEALTR